MSFDPTRDQPDNQIVGPDGNPVRLGSLRRTPDGKGIVGLFGDRSAFVSLTLLRRSS